MAGRRLWGRAHDKCENKSDLQIMDELAVHLKLNELRWSIISAFLKEATHFGLRSGVDSQSIDLCAEE
jgi:hypothetical protein